MQTNAHTIRTTRTTKAARFETLTSTAEAIAREYTKAARMLRNAFATGRRRERAEARATKAMEGRAMPAGPRRPFEGIGWDEGDK